MFTPPNNKYPEISLDAPRKRTREDELARLTKKMKVNVLKMNPLSSLLSHTHYSRYFSRHALAGVAALGESIIQKSLSSDPGFFEALRVQGFTNVVSAEGVNLEYLVDDESDIESNFEDDFSTYVDTDLVKSLFKDSYTMYGPLKSGMKLLSDSGCYFEDFYLKFTENISNFLFNEFLKHVNVLIDSDYYNICSAYRQLCRHTFYYWLDNNMGTSRLLKDPSMFLLCFEMVYYNSEKDFRKKLNSLVLDDVCNRIAFLERQFFHVVSSLKLNYNKLHNLIDALLVKEEELKDLLTNYENSYAAPNNFAYKYKKLGIYLEEGYDSFLDLAFSTLSTPETEHLLKQKQLYLDFIENTKFMLGNQEVDASSDIPIKTFQARSLASRPGNIQIPFKTNDFSFYYPFQLPRVNVIEWFPSLREFRKHRDTLLPYECTEFGFKEIAEGRHVFCRYQGDVNSGNGPLRSQNSKVHDVRGKSFQSLVHTKPFLKGLISKPISNGEEYHLVAASLISDHTMKMNPMAERSETFVEFVRQSLCVCDQYSIIDHKISDGEGLNLEHFSPKFEYCSSNEVRGEFITGSGLYDNGWNFYNNASSNNPVSLRHQSCCAGVPCTAFKKFDGEKPIKGFNYCFVHYEKMIVKKLKEIKKTLEEIDQLAPVIDEITDAMQATEVWILNLMGLKNTLKYLINYEFSNRLTNVTIVCSK